MLKGDTLPQAIELHHKMPPFGFRGHKILVPTTIFIPKGILTKTETLQNISSGRIDGCLITRDLDPFR